MVDLMPIYVNIMAFLCTVGAIALALSHIYMHLMNYTEPIYQRFIVRIILMVPVYALTSFLSLLFNQSSIYFNSIREVIFDKVSIASNIWRMDLMLLDRPPPLLRWAWQEQVIVAFIGYEAWVIYNFLSLCLAWVGGPGAVVLSLTGRVLKPSWYLMTCCLPPMPLDGRFIRRCKQGCLQFVILKPILVVVTLILYGKGKYHDGNFSPDQSYLYLTVIYTISYSLALYALVLFYVACEDLLKPFNPVPKFVIIKSVVFLTYWQGVLVFLAAKSKLIKDADEAASFQDFIICVEMLIAAIGHQYAFPYKEYAGANVGSSRGFTASLAHALMLNDFYHDTVHQFAPTYHDYVLYNDNEGEDGIWKYRSRTFVPTGPEMDAIRKNKNWLGRSKPDDVQLHTLPSSDTSSPKVTGVSASSDNMKSSLLVDTSNSLSMPYDMSLIDIDLSNSPRAAPSGNQPGKR